MTVATTSTAEMSIDQIVELAFRVAGLIPVQQAIDEARAAHGRDLLELEVKHLQAKGVYARSVDFYDLPLVAGTCRYTLPSNVLDVEGNGMYIPAGTADLTKAPSETLVSRMSQSEWHEMSSKASESIPLQMYIHRVPPLAAWFWPIPTEAGTVRLRIHRLFADSNTDGNATIDLERPWQQCMVYALAHQLAITHSLPLERVVILKREADELFRECKGFANEYSGSQIYLDHRSSWRNR